MQDDIASCAYHDDKIVISLLHAAVSTVLVVGGNQGFLSVLVRDCLAWRHDCRLDILDRRCRCTGTAGAAHLDVQQEACQALEQLADELWQFAHHARRLLAGLAERHQELCSQLPGAVLQAACLCDLQCAIRSVPKQHGGFLVDYE